MSTSQHWSCRVIILVSVLLGCLASTGWAQESQSASLTKQLTDLLDQAKLDAIAAKEPAQSDSYVAALYFAGSQLLVVSAQYSVPVLLNEKLEKKEYRDIYIDLNSASVAGTKVFIVDLGADGLKAKRTAGQPFDSYETAKQRLAFDNDWDAQKLTEEAYMAGFAEADARYTKMLTALVAQAKKR